MPALKPTKSHPPRRIAVNGREIPLTVRKRRRLRSMTLRFQPVKRELVLTLPVYVSLAEGMRFLESRRRWLERHVGRQPPAVPLAPGASIPVLGKEYALCHAPDRRGVVQAGEGVLTVCGDARFFERRLRDWLKKELHREMAAIAAGAAQKLGVRVRRISLRDTSSQWGSCTRDGTLSFSWRMVFAPRGVMEYLVCHEVAHLREMNHSARFWRLVHQLCPHHAQSRTWLKRHGDRLYAYGA